MAVADRSLAHDTASFSAGGSVSKSSPKQEFPKVKRSRDPLSPKPILDRRLLLSALASRSISLKEGQLDSFYQLLHRQHYPPLEEFVSEYYRHDPSGRLGTIGAPSTLRTVSPPAAFDKTDSVAVRQRQTFPTKNPITAKNKNLRQLPKDFIDFLADQDNDFCISSSTIDSCHNSRDGSTTKLGIRLQDGHVVESVIIRHTSKSGAYPSRTTLCVSSQVGCSMGCTFCATGTMGIRGNLCSGEILEQLVHASRILAKESRTLQSSDAAAARNFAVDSYQNGKKLDLVRNVVFMGMGEPLNNYVNVVEACRAMINRRCWNLAHGKVTVSTVGITPKMRQLTNDLPEVNLALSLHAPNQEMRVKIVPSAMSYPIEDMIEALDDHLMAANGSCVGEGTKNENKAVSSQSCANKEDEIDLQRKASKRRKRAMIEYIMLEGDTSSLQCAHQLGKLCENRQLVVNLIPYNETNVKDKLSCPSEERIRAFQNVISSYGVFCFIRKTMGADVAGACGQLVVEKERKLLITTLTKTRGAELDIEDGPFPKAVSTKNATRSRLWQKSRIQKGSCPDVAITWTGGKEVEENVEGTPIDRWIKPLAFTTAIAASCFVVSSALFFAQSRRR